MDVLAALYERERSGLGQHVPHDTFRCADGFIVIAVIADNFWQNLKQVVPCAEFDDPKFDGQPDQPGRWKGRECINDTLNEALSENTCAHWLAKLEARRIPCSPVNSFSQALSDPQVLHRNMVVDLHHPDGAVTRGPGDPIKMSRSSEESFSPAPLLGDDTDTDAVLSEILGMSVTEINSLKTQRVIA